jgi:hypothetical protein
MMSYDETRVYEYIRQVKDGIWESGRVKGDQGKAGF